MPSNSQITRIPSSMVTTTLSEASPDRLALYLYNDSTAILYVKCGESASATSFTVKLPAAGFFELPLPCFTGQVDGIWDADNGAALVTEITG